MDDSKYTLKQRFILGGLVSFFLTFTVLLYGPLNLYVEGAADLWFKFSSLILPTIIIFAIGFVVMLFITALPPKRVHKILCALAFGCGLAVFLQNSFLNISYSEGGLNGSEIPWGNFTGYGLMNTAIWIVCLAIPILLMIFFKKYFRTILIIGSICLVLIQCISFVTMFITNKDEVFKTNYEVTTDKMYELSKDDNTIVLLLDAFDQNYYEDYKERHPEATEKLKGFTEYNNTLASGARTIEGLPSLLTGEAYKKDVPYNQYINDIWNDDTVYKKLKDDGYDNRIFTETIYFGKDSTGYIDNVKESQSKIGSYRELITTMYKYTAYSYSPHFLKRYFVIDTADFNLAKNENEYSAGDVKIYNNYVDNGGFSYTDDYSKCFRFYHFEGAHTPYTMTENIERDKNGTSLKEQIDGTFNIVYAFLEDLQKNGVYDDASIIILADHGDVEKCQHSLFLYKGKGQSEGYEVNESPMSNFYVPKTIADIAGIDYTDKGDNISLFDIKKDDTRTRYYYLNTGSNNAARVEEYTTTYNAGEPDKMVLANTFMTNGGETPPYKLGELLTFTMDTTANVYCTEGFRQTTGWRTPMAGPHAQMVIPIEEIPEDAENLEVRFGIQTIDTESNTEIYANNQLIFSGMMDNKTYNKENDLVLTVPTSVIGEDNTLTLDFNYTDIDEKEMEIEDVNKRTMTVSVNSFIIDVPEP